MHINTDMKSELITMLEQAKEMGLKAGSQKDTLRDLLCFIHILRKSPRSPRMQHTMCARMLCCKRCAHVLQQPCWLYLTADAYVILAKNSTVHTLPECR